MASKKNIETKQVKPKEAKVALESKKSLKVSLFDLSGVAKGEIELPNELFGAKINKTLVAQAVRVYLANQRLGTASTKSRGEVDLTTAKWYRQKGTGRARHGAKSAPIFVKGGVAHGPKPHDFGLSMPRKMRRSALSSVLSEMYKQGNVIVVSGSEQIEPKTKQALALLKALKLEDKKTKVALVTGGESANLIRAARNLPGVSYLPVKQLSAYAVLNAGKLIFMQEAIKTLSEEK